MRKFLLTAIAALMTISMMAIGKNDGSTKANAIDFDWTDGNVHESTTALWYRVDLSSLEGVVDPTLALYLTNLTDQAAKVDVTLNVTVTVLGQSETREEVMNYTIAPKDHKLWSENVKSLLEMNVKHIFLVLKSDKKIALSAKLYETDDIVDFACSSAKDFDWTGVTVSAGEKWYRLNLAEVKLDNQELDFVITNNGSQAANVKFELSLDCPASTIWGYDWTIAAGAEMKEELGRVFINELKDDYVYLKLTNDQSITLSVEEKTAAPVVGFDCSSSEYLLLDEVYNLTAGEHVFEVELAALKAPRGMKAEFVITNPNGTDANFKKEIAFSCPVVANPIVKELIVPANSSVTKDVVNNMAGVINSEFAYVRFTTDQDLQVQLSHIIVDSIKAEEKPITTPTCENSIAFDWNSTIEQKALLTKWYELDIAPLKNNEEQVQLSFTNKSDSIVVVVGSILLDCASTDSIPYILPIPAGKTLSKVIDYSLLAASRLQKVYVSATVIPTTLKSLADVKNISSADLQSLVSTNLDATVAFSATKASALVDPTACQNAVTIQKGVEYTQAAGTTQWYRIPDALIDQLSFFPEFAFLNNGDKTANITLGATVGCDYGIVTKATVSLPTWADLSVMLPRFAAEVVDKVVSSDITEFYLEVTTDQPIMFGIDINYGFGFGCDQATPFDWSKGAVINAKDARWLEFDITSVKQNKEQVKLTFTNTSNSIAWVAAAVTYECPFTLALPMLFPVPAGMSIDKWIDYSYFASTPVEQVYVAVYSDSRIQLTAEAEKAEITPTTDCTNATLIEPNIKYTVQPGTHWYKLSNTPFAALNDSFPRISFANESEQTATISMGATVGCEYGILTKGKIKVPANFDFAVNVPRPLLTAIDYIINDDVTHYYTQITTNQPLSFMIQMDTTATEQPEEPVEPEEKKFVHDTINEYVCDGSAFVDPYTNDTVFIHRLKQTWSDTIATTDPLLDSVVTFVVTPIKSIDFEQIDLNTIYTTLPVLTPGKVPTVLSVDPIWKYYEDYKKANPQDSIADVYDMFWEKSTAVKCGATTHAMVLVVDAACDNYYYNELHFPVAQAKDSVLNVTICEGSSYTWRGQDYTKDGQYFDAEPFAGTTCDSIKYTLNLTINNTVYTEETVTACDSYDWNGQTYDKSDDYVYTTTAANGCDSVVTLHLTINKTVYTEETVTACDSYDWNGKTYDKSDDYVYTTTAANGCDSVVTLHLTINKPVKEDVYETACVSYTWNGQTYDKSDDYVYTTTAANGCDSIVTLHLTILPDVVYEPKETDYFCPGSTYDWRGHTFNAPGTYYDTIYNVLGCESNIYTLELLQYVNTIPTITADDIIAICGNAVDVTLAEAIIQDHIASEALYAPNAKIEWYILSGNTYTEMTNTAIDGTITEVTVKYAVVTDCGIVESDPVTVTVETPTPENDSEMANISALSKYGDRLLLINLKHIEETFGWNVAEEDVTWYYVVDDLDNYADDAALKNDIVLGHGYYYNENSGMPVPDGRYYARIAHEAAFESDCDGVLQTEVITCATSKAAPMLVPSMAKPQELIRLINLEPSEVISISVYSSTGENLGTYQVNSSEDMTFNAAQQAGFYLVDVNTESGKVSLRYIVK